MIFLWQTSAPVGTADAMKPSKIVKRFRIDKPKKFRLADHDPADTAGLDLDKVDEKALLATGIARLEELQERLYAENRWSVLVIFQAMDAAGKDGVIKHVMSGVNPQGCEVFSFKAPSDEERDHDFLWREAARLPQRGRIGIFNRSYYEEVLVVRVHPEQLGREKLPPQLITKAIWHERYTDICAFERMLAHNGTVILKFFLNVSREEQRRRFLARLDEPAKRWKFSMGDIAERGRWDAYMDAYEDMVRETSCPHAPWFVVPADNKLFTHMVVAEAMVDALERLDLNFPKIRGKALAELRQVRKALLAEKPVRRRKGKK
jgi:PPK2 family polyphosphate:nucleotide phosphotransferase